MEFKNQKPNRKSSWLDEENEWSELKQRVKRQAAQDAARNQYDASRGIKPAAPKSSDPEKVEVNIKLSLPKIDTTKVTSRVAPVLKTAKSLPNKLRSTTRKQRAIAGGALCAIVIGAFAFNLITKKDSNAEVQSANTTQAANANPDIIPSEKPLFDVVVPKGREIKKEQIAFDSKRMFAKYDDQINGIKITVTQQPLPESFKSDPFAKTEEVAKNFSATEKLISGEQAMFYGRSEKGPETVILTKKNLLIFINTVNQVDKESLKVYAANLD